MCGIVGILSPRRRDAIYKMTEAVAHRGPDDVGYYQDEFIALGQRRLSIIDLKGGNQPLTNETGSIHLICNGEIYNSPQLRRELLRRGHTFKTETDVEVILHLYEDHGPDCVRHLRGRSGPKNADLPPGVRPCAVRGGISRELDSGC